MWPGRATRDSCRRSRHGAVQWTATTGPAVQAIALGPDGVLYALTWANLFEYSTH